MELLFLSGKDVSDLMSFELAYKADEEAYKAYSSGKAIQPNIINFPVEDNKGEFNIKTAYSGVSNTMGVKIIGGSTDNAAKGLPSIMGVITLFDGKTGAPVSILDGSGVTYYRTAAAGAYAAKLLAKPDSQTMAVIGTGTLARMFVEAMVCFFDIKTINITGICLNDAEKMAADMSAKLPNVSFNAYESAKDSVVDADIICTATISREAIIKDGWVKKGAHINAFGADAEGKQELDEKLVASSKLVVDVLSECVKLGETQNAVKAGLITADDVYAEIGEIALGNKPGRTDPDEITIFDSTGMGLQDICTVAQIYNKAKETGVGTKVEL